MEGRAAGRAIRLSKAITKTSQFSNGDSLANIPAII